SPATAIPLQKAGLTMYDLRRHLQTGAGVSAPAPERPAERPDGALRRKPLPSLRGVLSVSPVFLAIVGVTAASGVGLWTGALPGLTVVLTLTFVTAGWIASLCVHEFSHALVAYLGGDRAVAASGYLTLDPLRYTNLLLSVVMPIVFLLLGGIGLPGGAVYINRGALRSRKWDSAVSLAGPAGTLLCGLLVAAPFLIPGHQSWITTGNLAFFGALAFLGFIEAVALLLNLLPIPGLDGFGVVRPWLPYSVQDWAVRYGGLAIIGIFVVLWYVAPVRDAFFSTVQQLTAIVQIDPGLIGYGQLNMRPH
ncbi:MAG TPA: site-2 protease family protein, partial [Patescibacteria group bacterium]|nr:site-2 protease family protein [Patescibacteria group bacterium]